MAIAADNAYTQELKCITLSKLFSFHNLTESDPELGVSREAYRTKLMAVWSVKYILECVCLCVSVLKRVDSLPP